MPPEARAGEGKVAGEEKAGATVTACLLDIGNEILTGRTQDKNIALIGQRLNELGIRLMEVRVVSDLEAANVAALNEVRRRFDYVFTTGGVRKSTRMKSQN